MIIKNSILVLFLVLIFSISCVSKSKKVKLTSIKFENSTHDFGDLQWKKNQTNKATFKFLNQGEDSLQIYDIQTSCGCITPAWKKDKIPLGEQNELTVKFKLTELGTFEKFIKVYYNGKDSPILLTIKGNVSFPGVN